jgi:hypothetical protein
VKRVREQSRSDPRVAGEVRGPDAEVTPRSYYAAAFGEERDGILDVLQNPVTDADINGFVGDWPARTLDESEFANCLVLLARGVDVDADYGSAKAFQDMEIAPDFNRVCEKATSPTADIEHDRRRLNQRPDPKVKSNRAVDVGEPAETGLGIVVL